MSAQLDLRWSERRSVFVPPTVRFDPSAFDVAALDSDVDARAFVEHHHYSRSYPAARRRFGLYLRGELAGVAVFSHPVADAVLTSVFPGPATDSVELGRFVLLDDVGFNGETWFLARAFELLRADGMRGVLSFSDPEPRTRADGTTIFPGHVGTIYQAHNARYLGRATARSLRLLPDGRVMSARAISKIRAGERGWVYAASLLVDAGADEPGADLRSWLSHWLPRVTRAIRHGGNHKYAWPIDRRLRRQVPATLPYPRAA